MILGEIASTKISKNEGVLNQHPPSKLLQHDLIKQEKILNGNTTLLRHAIILPSHLDGFTVINPTCPKEVPNRSI